MRTSASTDAPLRILHATPCYFDPASLIGGGERYVDNVCKAVRAAVALGGPAASCAVLSFGPEARGSQTWQGGAGDTHTILAGRPDAPASFDTAAIARLMAAADIVHVHQCLTVTGLFLASQARLRGCRVVGSDHGGGEMPFVQAHTRLLAVYDRIQTYSAFGGTAFVPFSVPVERILGPVDDDAFGLAPPGPRDPGLVLSIGRILPHKGFETIIDALPPGLRLVIAGRNYDPGYRRLLEDRARGKAVTFADGLDDPALRALIASAGLYVQTSTHFTAAGSVALKPELLGLAPLECLATGMPAIVSRAGALAELGALPGCRVAADGVELAGLLARWAAGTLEQPPAGHIREAVVARYGLLQFGRAYLAMLTAL